MTFPESLQEIGFQAFWGNELENVLVPGSVEVIGGGAFDYNKLTSVILEDGVTTIGAYAFAGDAGTLRYNQLTSIEIPSSVEFIDAHAFSGNQLSSIILPDNLKHIGEWAFRTNKLTKIALPKNLETLGDYAFGNNEISEIEWPDSINTISPGAFTQNKLTEITIPNGVTQIGNRSFSSNELRILDLPDSITTIEDWAFSGNDLFEVVIPENVVEIGVSPFNQNHLRTVRFLGDRPQLGADVFDGNPILKVVSYCLSKNDWPGDSFVESSIQPSPIDCLLDSDSDGVADINDADDDGDGVADADDAFPFDPTEALDTDSDGLGNNADTDDDGDGTPDGEDAFPLASEASVDSDNDGLPDQCVADICPTESVRTFPVLVDGSVNLNWGSEINAYSESAGYATCNPGRCGFFSWDHVVSEGASSLKLSYFGFSYFAAMFFKADAPIDMKDYLDGSLVVRAKYLRGPSNVSLKVDCTFPCGSEFLEQQAAEDSWSVLKFNVNELVESGLDISKVSDVSLKGSHLQDSDLLISDVYWETAVRIQEDDDDDNDGFLDVNDRFPLDAAESVDTDLDGVGDNADNDDDGDGIADNDDAFPLDPTKGGADADADDDGDGVLNLDDAFPSDSAGSVDTDGDGMPDDWNEGKTQGDSTSNPALVLDEDDDNDGLSDEVELSLGTDPLLMDTDGDSLSDKFEHESRSRDALRSDYFFSVGPRNGCVFDDDEVVKCWGDQQHGMLEVPVLNRVLDLDVGWLAACVAPGDGNKAQCWGDGWGASHDSLANVSIVSVGDRNSCVYNGLQVRCNSPNSSIEQVPFFGSEIVDLQGGANHVCALESNGKVTCWGGSSSGQTEIPTDKVFTKIAVGPYSTCGVTEDSQMICAGGLSSGGANNLWQPPEISNVTSFDISSDSGCVNDKGEVDCWGNYVQSNGSAALQPIVPLSPTAIVGVGLTFACALDGAQLSCWGYDEGDRGYLKPPGDARFGDKDGDGLRDDEDNDDDNDGVSDSSDAFPLDATESLDTDSDGVGDNEDTDDDGDGVSDTSDAFPLDASESVDTDADGVGNNADTRR